MKTLILLCTVFSLSLAKDIFDIRNFNIENLKFDIDKSLEEDLLQKYEEGATSEIIAVINDYADIIFKNIEDFARRDHLDPLTLADVEDDFLTASITLTNGSMNGIPTIDRADDVMISYSSETKILQAYFPIVFSNLNFTYDYHVIILLIGPKGSIVGKVSDFQMDILMQFDFNTYQASVVNVETSNKGHVSVSFHGNGITDIVANILLEFVTTVLQPVIEFVIEGVVSFVVDLVVSTINSAIDSILNPGGTTVASLI